MKKLFKKTVAALVALTSIVSVCNMKAGAYYAGQKLTWRIYEKTATIGMDYYTSVIKCQSSGYTFGKSVKGDLIVNSSGFQSNYSSTLKALTTSYSGPPKINGEGYLAVSTWYTPTTVSNLSYSYSYETSNGASVSSFSVLVGDINQDGFVNKLDAEEILGYHAQISVGNTPSGYTYKGLLAADVNNDGYIDTSDAYLVLRFSEGYQSL